MYVRLYIRGNTPRVGGKKNTPLWGGGFVTDFGFFSPLAGVKKHTVIDLHAHTRPIFVWTKTSIVPIIMPKFLSVITINTTRLFLPPPGKRILPPGVTSGIRRDGNLFFDGIIS